MYKDLIYTTAKGYTKQTAMELQRMLVHTHKNINKGALRRSELNMTSVIFFHKMDR